MTVTSKTLSGDSPPAFEVVNVGKRFGGLVALDDVAFSAQLGSVTAVLGPNGAGKTTLMDLISGFASPDSGDIRAFGESILGIGAAARCDRGLGRTFQHPKGFAEETVFQNVLMGTFSWNRYPLLSWFRNRGRWAAQDEVDEALEVVGLSARADLQAAGLPYGLQKELDVARAIVGRPRILLMDEPLAGLSRDESDRMLALIRRLARRDILILLVEHHLAAVAKVADAVLVLHHGRQIACGTVSDVYRHADVRTVYTAPGRVGS